MLLVGGWLRWPGDLYLKSADSVAAWKTAGSVLAPHWGSLDGGVLFGEARWSQTVDLSRSHLSLRRPAPLTGYIATYRTCHANTRNALLQVNVLTGPGQLGNWLTELNWSVSRSRSQSYFTTDSQSVSMSWYQAPLWDLWPDVIFCQNVAVWNLQSCIYGAPSLTRGRVCNLWCNHSMVRFTQNPKPYFTVSSDTPQTWRSRFPYLYPPGTGWPSYTPRHWVPFTSSLRTRRATVKVF
jgi:hypothetical protein